MTHKEILRELASLPPEGQRQVADFIALLRQRYARSQSPGPVTSDLAQDGFIGMWRDREDMLDSSAWVRKLREREWVKQSG
jgi:DNA-directed RNA polymerase specialized sigma24 family protein